MRIFAVVPLQAGGVKMTVGLSTTVIFGDLGGYTSVDTLEIRQYYMAICCPLLASN